MDSADWAPMHIFPPRPLRPGHKACMLPPQTDDGGKPGLPNRRSVTGQVMWVSAGSEASGLTDDSDRMGGLVKCLAVPGISLTFCSLPTGAPARAGRLKIIWARQNVEFRTSHRLFSCTRALVALPT